MDLYSRFGLFSRLPPEIRLQIWQHFLPEGQDTDSLQAPKSDLKILRASRSLYEEISEYIYSQIEVSFEFSPIYDRHRLVKVHCQERQSRCPERTEGDYRKKATWILRNRLDAQSRGFFALPYQKVDITINLLAPDQDDGGQIIWLWKKVTEFVQILKTSPSVRHIALWLQKGPETDWYQIDDEGPYIQSNTRPNNRSRWDYELVFLPFCSLRNLQSIEVRAHCQTLEDTMNWSMIKNGEGAVRRRAGKPAGALTGTSHFTDNEIDFLVAEDYLRLEYFLIETWGETSRPVRVHHYSTWFEEGTNGYSEHEERLFHIFNTYPDLVEEYDPDLFEFEDHYQHLACLFYHAKWILIDSQFGDPVYSDLDYWDPELWLLAESRGLTEYWGLDYWRERDARGWGVVDDRLYHDMVTRYSRFTAMDGFIKAWKQKPKGDVTGGSK